MLLVLLNFAVGALLCVWLVELSIGVTILLTGVLMFFLAIPLACTLLSANVAVSKMVKQTIGLIICLAN